MRKGSNHISITGHGLEVHPFTICQCLSHRWPVASNCHCSSPQNLFHDNPPAPSPIPVNLNCPFTCVTLKGHWKCQQSSLGYKDGGRPARNLLHILELVALSNTLPQAVPTRSFMYEKVMPHELVLATAKSFQRRTTHPIFTIE